MAMAAPLAAEGAAAGGAATAEGAAGAPLRTPRAGGSSMAVDRHNRPPKPKPKPAAKPAAKPEPKPEPTSDPAPTEEKPEEASEDAPESRRHWRGLPNPGGRVREGSWIALGFLGWVWVALPFIKNGPSGVRDVLAAKFLNRTTDGSSS